MSTNTTTEDTRPFAWFRTLGRNGKRAFIGAFGGYGLDSYDYWVLPLSLVAITSYFGITKGQAGLLGTATLLLSAIGGAVAGVMADRLGRSKTLMITVGMYALFTVLCGFAWSYESLLVFRALQGLGFGGEWAAGAILVAEYCKPQYRGRTVAFIQSAWSVGWGLAVIAYTLVFMFADADSAWRIMFWTGALPALLIFYVRRNVQDAPEVTKRREESPIRGSFKKIFQGEVGRKTFFLALLATGVQGGYYTLATWLPAYLKTERHLTVVGTGGYLAFLIVGAFVGYVSGGYLTDYLGRKKTFTVFALASAVLIIAYTQIPTGANTLVLFLGFPLGFCMSAIFSGFGSYLAENYPDDLRGTGQGFTYNFGRAFGAVFPGLVGFLAESWGIGGAMVFAAVAYGVAVLALIPLPETANQKLPS
ncbi:MFS transporter [Lentzea tibetensis]|uniref:MFS transporter n=1 Tax=Lentzea tibetensis TaxID=2591470 RepID=A0A563ERY7_9PSEU|nr:MFS transporter [Lentzea tibetensis]TWP50291.1 MFS transporter [Lentzea tibetensis]